MSEEEPSYHGESMALHVETDAFPTPTPVGPVNPDPVMSGQAPKITTHDDSPSQWSDATITGYNWPVSVYRGRSQAIHVFGEVVTTGDPPQPIPACRCCAEQGGGVAGCTLVEVDGAGYFLRAFAVQHTINEGSEVRAEGSPTSYVGASLVDYPFGDPLEVESHCAVVITPDEPILAAGATHVKVRGRLYSVTCLPTTYAVAHDWVIYQGTWPGDAFDDVPAFGSEIGAIIASGTVNPNAPLSGSLAGSDYDEIEIDVPLVGGVAKFVLAFGPQLMVNGSDDVGGGPVVTAAPRYPDFAGLDIAQSDASIWIQHVADTEVSIGEGIRLDVEGYKCVTGLETPPVPGSSEGPGPGTGTGPVIYIASGEQYHPEPGEVLEGITFIGPGDNAYDGETAGVLVEVDDVKIRHCRFKGFGDAAIRANDCDGLEVTDNIGEDCAYAGFIGTGITNFKILRNAFYRIGTHGHQVPDQNAYGIVISMWEGLAPSADGEVAYNLVDGVPLWEGYDTHGGYRIDFHHNMALHCARAYIITSNADSERAHNVTMRSNFAGLPQSDIPAGGTDANKAYTTYDTRDCTVIDNVSDGYPLVFYDYLGLSTGLTESGNVEGTGVPDGAVVGPDGTVGTGDLPLGTAAGDCGNDGTSSDAGCSTLENFSNRTTSPGDGWGDASYQYPSTDPMHWTSSDPDNAWVETGVGKLRVPATYSGTPIEVEGVAPDAYGGGDVAIYLDGFGYWYTITFRASEIVASSKFKFHDFNTDVEVNLFGGSVSASRRGATGNGTLTASTSSAFVEGQEYVLTVFVDELVTRVQIDGMLSISSTTTATLPLHSNGTSPFLSVSGTGVGEAGFVVEFLSIKLEPCDRPLAAALYWSGYRLRQKREATALGGPASVIDTSSEGGDLEAWWDTTFDDPFAEGRRETEQRAWTSYLIPPGGTSVRILGEATTFWNTGEFLYALTPLDVPTTWELGPVSVGDPDSPPSDFEATGTGMGGSGTTHVSNPPVTQTPVPIDYTSSSFGGTFDAGDGIAWRLFQLGLKVTSAVGEGRHVIFSKSGTPDQDVIEIVDRFPNNPDWHHFGIGSPYVDETMPMSGVTADVEGWVYGVHGGTPGAGGSGGGGGGGSCAECEDPDNPGINLPDFTPGFMPTFRKQIGDPTTTLDSFICTLESAAMVLDWHTRGAIKVWGGELIPYCGKTTAQIAATGSNLDNARQAWLHWSQVLDNRSGQTWDALVIALTQGRAVVLQGDYGIFNLAERCQDSFEDNHAISVYPYQVGDRYLIGDPLCSDFTGMKISSLKAYAEAFGRAVFGATSPQKILFAVSRPWTP